MIGFMSSRSAGDFSRVVAAFRQGLAETSPVEGRNVLIEFRWAQGQFDRLSALATELVGRRVPLSPPLADTIGARRKAATGSIPIVFEIGEDPVDEGLVTSLSRPDGNITGATFFTSLLGAKRLDRCATWFPARMRSLCWLTRTPRRGRGKRETCRTRLVRSDNGWLS